MEHLLTTVIPVLLLLIITDGLAEMLYGSGFVRMIFKMVMKAFRRTKKGKA